MNRRIHRRLQAIGAEIATVRAELAVLAEQASYTAGVADDARVDAVVSSSPLAARDLREAQGDAQRLAAARDAARRRLAALRAEQDELLERLGQTGTAG